MSLYTRLDLTAATITKAGGIEIRPLSEHQNHGLENVNMTTATLIKFAQKILYKLISYFSKTLQSKSLVENQYSSCYILRK
jgi:hypothetical protein